MKSPKVLHYAGPNSWASSPQILQKLNGLKGISRVPTCCDDILWSGSTLDKIPRYGGDQPKMTTQITTEGFWNEGTSVDTQVRATISEAVITRGVGLGEANGRGKWDCPVEDTGAASQQKTMGCWVQPQQDSGITAVNTLALAYGPGVWVAEKKMVHLWF